MPIARLPLPALSLAFFLGLAAPAFADETHDHDRARRALEAGEILPLPAILERVERDVPGQILEVELERHDGRWIYEVKVLRPGGSLAKLKVDARDGSVLRRKSSGDEGDRRRGVNR